MPSPPGGRRLAMQSNDSMGAQLYLELPRSRAICDDLPMLEGCQLAIVRVPQASLAHAFSALGMYFECKGT